MSEMKTADIVDRLQNSNDRLLMCGQDYSDVLLDAANEIVGLRRMLYNSAKSAQEMQNKIDRLEEAYELTPEQRSEALNMGSRMLDMIEKELKMGLKDGI